MNIISEIERTSLINSMKTLLNDYDYDYTIDALNSIIDEWAAQKESLIEAFKRHPNYIESKFMIAFDMDYTREVNQEGLGKFSMWLMTPIKTLNESIPKEIYDQARAEGYDDLPDDLYRFLTDLDKYQSRTVTEELAKHINNMLPLRIHVGEKMSRVVNKICKYLGYDKHPDYNREFAKYADALNPLTIKRHTILSINPLDYLTMSFGNSWASCHTIDKNNIRNMPNSYEGQYSSGTISYMLDPSSMVFYTVDAAYDEKEYYSQPKINRQMFHWGERKLVQGRLYPQGNDCNDEAYRPYRELVQEIISTIFDFPNLWTTNKGTQSAGKYIQSEGTHYEDYRCFNNCRLCRPKDDTNENMFTVGARPICIECGGRHNVSDNINCCTSGVFCADCGCRIDSEYDECYVNGDIYCRDCVSYCDCCEDYTREDVTYIISENRYVCESCLNEHYGYCDECNEYEPLDRIRYIEEEDIYICDDCDHIISECDCCGREFLTRHLTETDDGRELCSDCMEEEEVEDDEEN